MIEEGTPIQGKVDGCYMVGYTYFNGSDMWVRGANNFAEAVDTPLYCVDDWRVIHN